MIQLKPATSKLDFKNIKNLYKKAFPKCERKPFKKILQLNSINACDVFCITDEEQNFYGLVITIKHKNLALLDYFAICPQFRNQGIGSNVLKQIQNLYKPNTLIIEIEDASDGLAKNIYQRIRRRSFYLKNNMNLQNFKVNLFGCPMEILTYNGDISFNDYHEIFKQFFNQKFYSKIRLI